MKRSTTSDNKKFSTASSSSTTRTASSLPSDQVCFEAIVVEPTTLHRVIGEQASTSAGGPDSGSCLLRPHQATSKVLPSTRFGAIADLDSSRLPPGPSVSTPNTNRPRPASNQLQSDTSEHPSEIDQLRGEMNELRSVVFEMKSVMDWLQLPPNQSQSIVNPFLSTSNRPQLNVNHPPVNTDVPLTNLNQQPSKSNQLVSNVGPSCSGTVPALAPAARLQDPTNQPEPAILAPSSSSSADNLFSGGPAVGSSAPFVLEEAFLSVELPNLIPDYVSLDAVRKLRAAPGPQS
jgi:hypothetical protein